MNAIPEIQIEATQLDRLAAQRNLYSRAKEVQGWQVVLSVPCVIGWSFAVLAVPALGPYAALWGIVITLLDSVALDPWQKSLKERAARIQELFDCDVLELPWPELKSRRPEAELIAEHSSRYRRTDPEYKSIHDWYAPVVKGLPIHLGRLVCQRSSCWWDAKLRRRYAVWVLSALGVFSTLIIVLSLLGDASLQTFILTGITPLMPAIMLATKQFTEHNESATRADRSIGLVDKHGLTTSIREPHRAWTFLGHDAEEILAIAFGSVCRRGGVRFCAPARRTGLAFGRWFGGFCGRQHSSLRRM
jgi:hypothetical protein